MKLRSLLAMVPVAFSLLTAPAWGCAQLAHRPNHGGHHASSHGGKVLGRHTSRAGLHHHITHKQ